MELNKELVKIHIDLALTDLKKESIQLYESMRYKVHKSALIFFSGTLIIFFVNVEQIILLSDKGPTIWSIVCLTLSVLLQWIKYLPQLIYQNIKPSIENYMQNIHNNIKLLDKEKINDEDYINALFEKLKESQLGIEVLKSIKKNLNSKDNTNNKVASLIDEFIYSDIPAHQILLSLKDKSEKEKVSVLDSILNKASKDSLDLLYPLILYISGMLVFVISLFVKNFPILFKVFS